MTTETPIPNAGVRFPPPLMFALGLVVGWIIQRTWPLPLPGSWGVIRPILAAVLIVAWFALMLWAFASFRKAHTAIIPHRPAKSIVTYGPYQFTRNPMYVSMTLVYVGLALTINSWWPFVLLPFVLAIIRLFVIAREERYLTSAFPVEYPAYCQRVRRWL